MLEAPEPPHAPHNAHRWFDIAVALAIVLVSLGSLYVSLHTGKTMEQLVEQNARLVRANSVPLLQFDHGNISDAGAPELYLMVKNVGTGPARIVWFEVKGRDGRPVRNYLDLLPPGTKLSRSDAGIITGGIAPSMMPAGERRRLLRWPRPKAGAAELAAWDYVNKERDYLTVEACYCSLFDECWLTKASADVPQPMSSCPLGNRTTYQG
jgi:hypothetical protein